MNGESLGKMAIRLASGKQPQRPNSTIHTLVTGMYVILCPQDPPTTPGQPDELEIPSL